MLSSGSPSSPPPLLHWAARGPGKPRRRRPRRRARELPAHTRGHPARPQAGWAAVRPGLAQAQ
eukprot:115697-Lingulodinium_polyedra.AAC.1